MSRSMFLAVIHYDLKFGLRCIAFGVVFGGFGFLVWRSDRKKGPEQRRKTLNTMGGQRAYVFLGLGSVALVVGVVLVVIRLF